MLELLLHRFVFLRSEREGFVIMLLGQGQRGRIAIQIHEREAYRALFSFGGTLESLDPRQVGNLQKAITNAREFTAEVVSMLRAVPQEVVRRAGAV